MATNHTPWIHVIKMLHSHQEYTMDLCSRKLKIGHSHKTYKVDLCINTNHKYSITTWIKKMRPRVFNAVLWKYESSHVITCVKVEHGRNHLIIDHWWKPLTSAREISIDVNDSQGTKVQSKWMRMHEMKSSTQWNLSIRDQWCETPIESEETFH